MKFPYTIGFCLPIVFLLTACFNLYDLKNPFRKEEILENLISSEVYLIRTNDKTFDFMEKKDDLFGYIVNGAIRDSFSKCGQNATIYYRKTLSKDEFRKYVPNIVLNMKGTLMYSYFINYKMQEYDVYPFNFSPVRLAKFAAEEQKNIQLIKIDNNYICVSIKY